VEDSWRTLCESKYTIRHGLRHIDDLLVSRKSETSRMSKTLMSERSEELLRTIHDIDRTLAGEGESEEKSYEECWCLRRVGLKCRSP